MKQKFQLGDIVQRKNSKHGTIYKVVGININGLIGLMIKRKGETKFHHYCSSRESSRYELKKYTDDEILKELNDNLLSELINEHVVTRVPTLNRDLEFTNDKLIVGCQKISPKDALTIAKSIQTVYGN